MPTASEIATTIKDGLCSRRKKTSEIVVLAASAVQVTAPANDTNENVLATVTIPAGAMGKNGFLRVWASFNTTNSSNNKQLRARLGGLTGTAVFSCGVTTTLAESIVGQVQNRGAENSQVIGSAIGSFTGLGNVGNSLSTATIDTAQETTLVITAQKATGTETVTLERYIVELHHRR